ncbi:MAG: glycoside hydrolase family 127 protein, partial [Brachybacterium sp.]|nr:glycoside hydrolase family 127 protein [Brachybacterium sp.]
MSTHRTAPPVLPTAPALGALRPLDPDDARITGGFWSVRQHRNGGDAIRAGHERLEESGTLQNFRIAAGDAEGEARGMIFQDSDAYKWLEALAFEIGRTGDAELLALQRDVTATIAAAQAEDGYLNSVHQLRHGVAERYTNLAWNHELYCYGHLMQAAIAQVRCTGDNALLQVALRILDHLGTVFGPEGIDGVPGHPEIEMALVELYRETGREDARELARFFLERRGHGTFDEVRPDPTYFSARVPVREATTVEGHAVRALYLAAGATDLAVEDHDAELVEHLERLFATAWSTKTYVTGGMGSRWDWEAFGDPFELTTDRGYAETCAGIGAMQWAWRLLLATGDARYADAIERLLYNAILPGVSLAGTEFFYVNSLQLRDGAHADENRSIAHGRRGWFDCACCPPNVMRTLASLDQYVATADAEGLQFHQFASGTWTARIEGQPFSVEVTTDYPHAGEVTLRVVEAPDREVALSLRIPPWSQDTTLTVAGEEVSTTAGQTARITRTFQVDDVVTLELDLRPRFTGAPHRVDASRGAVVLERGPLVYALEQQDQSGQALVDDAMIDPGAAVREQYL